MIEKPTKEQQPRLLLSSREAAQALGVCERTLWSLTKKGDIPVIRIGRAVRYSVEQLEEWIKNNSVKAV